MFTPNPKTDLLFLFLLHNKGLLCRRRSRRWLRMTSADDVVAVRNVDTDTILQHVHFLSADERILCKFIILFSSSQCLPNSERSFIT